MKKTYSHPRVMTPLGSGMLFYRALNDDCLVLLDSDSSTIVPFHSVERL